MPFPSKGFPSKGKTPIAPEKDAFFLKERYHSLNKDASLKEKHFSSGNTLP